MMIIMLLLRVNDLLLQVWIRPGGGLAEDYLAILQSFTNDNTEATILLILGVFALFHSGLAGLRPQGACNSRLHGFATLLVCSFAVVFAGCNWA